MIETLFNLAISRQSNSNPKTKPKIMIRGEGHLLLIKKGRRNIVKLPIHIKQHVFVFPLKQN